ncbi:hypothetical protein Hanom_Chr12g01129791 [Helianthus anomalus]
MGPPVNNKQACYCYLHSCRNYFQVRCRHYNCRDFLNFRNCSHVHTEALLENESCYILQPDFHLEPIWNSN